MPDRLHGEQDADRVGFEPLPRGTADEHERATGEHVHDQEHGGGPHHERASCCHAEQRYRAADGRSWRRPHRGLNRSVSLDRRAHMHRA